jgi:hypothetical protein
VVVWGMGCLYRLREMAYGVNAVSSDFVVQLNAVRNVEELKELVKEFEEKLMKVVDCKGFENRCKFTCLFMRAVVEYEVGLLRDVVRFAPTSIVEVCKALRMFDEIREKIQSLVNDITQAISEMDRKSLDGVEV